ncbi:MAG: hypothetical protein HY557_07985 [Euryarchaeota archaeon]|nr:hypothetical protein [Euryarchaeota archaeon]
MDPNVGEVFVTLKVHGPRRSIELERVLVDTGAIHSMIEKSIADHLGIQPEARGVLDIVRGEVELSMSTAVLEIEGRSFRVPIILGDQNLVGLTTLETLLFAVDPTTQKLIPRHGVLFPASEPLAVA